MRLYCAIVQRVFCKSAKLTLQSLYSIRARTCATCVLMCVALCFPL